MKKNNFDIGDLVENTWVDDNNPIKRMIYIGQQKYLCMDGRIICISASNLDGGGPLCKVGSVMVCNWRHLLRGENEG